MTSLFLMGWNVAGLSTVVRRIQTSYGSSSSTSSSSSSYKSKTGSNHQFPAMARYLERHGSPDIVCFQEHKIPKSQLSNRSEPQGCALVEGYESFWSDTNGKGMNGVVTYAKKGTVVKANATPLEDSSLDEQGRCIMTDHGNFVVFNVYVPCSGGHPTSEKMRFLQALRRAMKKQRTQYGKAVILTGDLNVSYDKLDVYWKDQVLHVNDILQQVNNNTTGTTAPDEDTGTAELPTWKVQLAKAWPLIVETLQTKKAVPQQTQNSATGATFDRYRLTVTMENPKRTIQLGKPQQDPDYCFCGYDFSESGHYQDPDTDEWILKREANVVHLYILQELMKEIAKIEWTETTLRQIADSSDAGRARIHPPRQWLRQMMKEDDMVDTFRHLYPTAQGRFTCWHQYTNTRYINEGARIDFVLVDRCLLPFLESGGPLRTGQVIDKNNNNATTNETPNQLDPLSEDAALAAATARGQFQAVPFQGGGIVEPTQRALDTQFGPRHTGIIYTPPSFSDHAAVSLLLGSTASASAAAASPAAETKDDNNSPTKTSTTTSWRCEDWGKLVLDEKDSKTKRTQPHKAQKTIASFFSTNTNTKSSKSTTTGKPTLLPQKRPPPTTVKSFFQPKTTTATTVTNNSGSQNVAPAGTQTSRVQAKSTTSNGNGRGASTNGALRKKRKAAPSILNHFAKK